MDGVVTSTYQYLTEVNQEYYCNVEPFIGTDTDRRYTTKYESNDQSTFQIKEWEVLQENGVGEFL